MYHYNGILIWTNSLPVKQSAYQNSLLIVSTNTKPLCCELCPIPIIFPHPETPTLYHLSPELQIPHKYSCDLLIHCTKVSYIRGLLCCRSYKLFYHQIFWRIFARWQLTITESEKLFLEISKRKLKINVSYINNKTKRKSKPNLHNTYEYKIYKIKLYYWYEEIYALKYLWKNKLQNKPKESKMKELMEIKV